MGADIYTLRSAQALHGCKYAYPGICTGSAWVQICIPWDLQRKKPAWFLDLVVWHGSRACEIAQICEAVLHLADLCR